MAEPSPKRDTRMMLVEPEVLMRRTVAMTARSLGMSDIYEAASVKLAQQMMRQRVFHGAVIALDEEVATPGEYDLRLVDEVRQGKTASPADIPIAVMAGRCDATLVQELRQRHVDRVILKPFRASVLLDVFSEFSTKP